MNLTLSETQLPAEKKQLSILIADDHSIVRIGLKIIISQINSEINIEEATDGETVTRKVKSGAFDLLILDSNMPRTEPFSLTAWLLKEFPKMKILLFTINKELTFAKRFLKLGVHGYLIKQSGRYEITQAIGKIIDGEVYVSDLLLEIVPNDLINLNADNPFDLLSDREFEVVLQILKGYSVAEIAETLHINPSTIGTHKSRILRKLKLANALELYSLARTHRIV